MKDNYELNVIRKAEASLNYLEDASAIGNLTLSRYTSSARGSMLTQHLVQAPVPDNGELPAMSTGFEQMYAEYSDAYYTTNTKYKIVAKIKKFSFSDIRYILVLYDKKNNHYEIVERFEVRDLAESYGYRWKNDTIDSYKSGDTIQKDTMLYHSPSVDQDLNYMYGLNANVLYIVSQGTLEDAVWVDKDFAKKASFTKTKSFRIPLNENDIPLNVYGDKESYKFMPNVGEYIKDCIICATRRKDNKTAQYTTKNSMLRKILPNDDIFQSFGKYQICDVSIWSNKTVDDIPDTPAYKQIKTYYTEILRYYKEIYDIFGDIIDSDASYSTELSRLYAEARDFLDEGCKYTENDRMFSNMVMEITIAKTQPLEMGSKLTFRYGNKSVISRIVDNLGRTEDGRKVDIIIDALGVVGRLNSGQIIEQELNWVAHCVKMTLMQMTKNEDRIKLLLEFYKKVDVETYHELKDYYFNELTSKEDQDAFFDETIKDRLYIKQDPMTNTITGDGLKELEDHYKPEKTWVYMSDEDGEFRLRRKCIVAEEYMMILKQTAESKCSFRSKGMINPRNSMPIKSLKASKMKSLFSDQACRVGEQELSILTLSNDANALDYFYKYYATSIESRRDDTLFTEDPMDGYEINAASERNKSVDVLNAYTPALGWKLNVEYDKDEDSEEDEEIDEDNVDLPDFIKDMFKD